MNLSPFSGVVLGSAAVVASPALYQGFVTGTMPFHVTLVRYLVATLLAWAAISLVAELVGPGAAAPVREDQPDVAPAPPTSASTTD
ncbi:MAG: hypothetical protein ACTHJH_14445 [Marmoricola sp.]